VVGGGGATVKGRRQHHKSKTVLDIAPVPKTTSSSLSLALSDIVLSDTQIQILPTAFPETAHSSARLGVFLVAGIRIFTALSLQVTPAISAFALPTKPIFLKITSFVLAKTRQVRASSGTSHVSRWPAAVHHQARATMNSS
jgi:hypothetical protein